MEHYDTLIASLLLAEMRKADGTLIVFDGKLSMSIRDTDADIIHRWQVAVHRLISFIHGTHGFIKHGFVNEKGSAFC